MRKIAVSTPYPRLDTTAAGSDEPVLVVLTRARIDRAARAEFDRQTRLVIDGMARQPGLLGYSVRRELFGNTVWTLTVWANDDACVGFIAGGGHRTAVLRSGAAVLAMESWRARLAPADIPANWAAALKMFTGRGSVVRPSTLRS